MSLCVLQLPVFRCFLAGEYINYPGSASTIAKRLVNLSHAKAMFLRKLYNPSRALMMKVDQKLTKEFLNSAP